MNTFKAALRVIWRHRAYLLVYLFGLHTRTIQRFPDDNGAEIRCGNGGKRAAHHTDGGSACACQNYFSAHMNPPSARTPDSCGRPKAA